MRFSAADDVLITNLRRLLRSSLSASRYLHSELVASCASTLCIRFGLDQEKGFLAGLAHDLARELPGDELLRIIRDAECEPTREEAAQPKLLHGPAGAILLQERFGIRDPEILEAVRLHTTGARGMGPIARVVFCADLLERSRTDVSEAWRDVAFFSSLDRIMTLVIERTFGYLHARGKSPAEESVALYRELSGL